MTNKEIIEHDINMGGSLSYMQLLDLARADEREKMVQEKFAEYFNTLQGGEVASAILTQLLRRGVTDDDLRGLRLQWIKDQPQGVDVWVSRDKANVFFETYEIWDLPPLLTKKGYYNGAENSNVRGRLAEKLGVAKGQCRKFRIVRVE